MRIAIYARKSTESEDRQVQSLEDQIKELSRLATREGLRIAEIFQESKSAKLPRSRPEFERLAKSIEAGSISGILTWSINRLSRNEIDGNEISYLLRTGKLQFVRTPERTYTPEDSALLLAIENGLATAYLQDLSRNVKRGMKGKIERGWHACKAPVGYKNDAESRQIVPDPDRFHLLRRGWDLMLSGQYSVAEAHREIVKSGLSPRSKLRSQKPISISRLHTIFRDRFYYGDISYRGESFPGKHQPMVTEDEFQVVQAFLEQRSRGKKPPRKTFPLGRTFWCGVCGCAVVGDKRVKHYPRTGRTATYLYYHCSTARGCSAKGVRQEELVADAEPKLLNLRMNLGTANWLKDSLVESFEREAVDTGDDIAGLQKAQANQESRLKRLAVMKMDAEVSGDEYASLRDEILDKIANVREQIHKARQASSQVLRHIYRRLDAAVAANQLTSLNGDPAVIGKILQIAGPQTLNLSPFELQLDPILTKITTFEPLRDGSEKPKHGDILPLSSVWWALVEDLRTCATDQIVRENGIRATESESS